MKHQKANDFMKTSIYANFLNVYQPFEVGTHNLLLDNVGHDVK